MSKLKKWRKDRQMSQAELGEKLGVTSVAVGRYEGGRVPEPDVLQKLIDISEGEITANDFFVIPGGDDLSAAAPAGN